MQCNICENTIPAFIGTDKTCPVCHCRQVHRALIKKFGKDIIKKETRTLHIGPHVALVRYIEKEIAAHTDSAYIPIDPRPGKNTIVPIDITEPGLKIHECDIVICLGVLDEIKDEAGAMGNILNSMKAGATLLFTVPLKAGATDRGYETEEENSHAEAKTKEKKHVKVLKTEDRETRFGGKNKFRKYGSDDILDFIIAYGFTAKFTKVAADASIGTEALDIIEATKQ